MQKVAHNGEFMNVVRVIVPHPWDTTDAVQGRKVLFRQRESDCDFNPDLWEVPGGQEVEEDHKDLHATAAREVLEETGITIIIPPRRTLFIVKTYVIQEGRHTGVRCTVFAGVADYESGDLDTPNGRWLDPTQELGGIALTEHTAKIMVRYNSGGIH